MISKKSAILVIQNEMEVTKTTHTPIEIGCKLAPGRGDPTIIKIYLKSCHFLRRLSTLRDLSFGHVHFLLM